VPTGDPLWDRSLRWWHIPLAVLQLVGLVCVMAAAWAIWDGWTALGVFGALLIALCELIVRRFVPVRTVRAVLADD
jgi:hypothetical protein